MKLPNRKLVGSSHGGRYTYWLDKDRYVYQFDMVEKKWIGWLCAESSWGHFASYHTPEVAL